MFYRRCTCLRYYALPQFGQFLPIYVRLLSLNLPQAFRHAGRVRFQ